MNITLPGSGDSKKVEIFVTDSNGRREVYSQTAAPGSNIAGIFPERVLSVFRW